MNNAILTHTMAILAGGSSLVYCYDLQLMSDLKKYSVQEEWNVTKSGREYDT